MEQLEQLEACRICVNCFPLKDMDFINIFQPNETFQRELDFIQGEIRQWELKIQPNDGLPQRICGNCFATFCGIEAFSKECISAQKKLMETLMQQTINTETGVQHIIKNTQLPLPLVGNYEAGANISLDSSSNILVSSLNLTQNDVSLSDFPVYDQQFAHYDNPALMDASATLLDSNLIAPETAQELHFLPTQNLYTFETAETPSEGTLPLYETEATSIINEVLVENPNNENNISEQNDDVENMLQHSIIPTNIKLEQNKSARLNINQHANLANAAKEKYKKEENQNTPVDTLNREDSNSDIECDDSEMNARLKGLTYACHYCFCPETGPIEHIDFSNEEALSQHFFAVHDPNRPYSCPQCPQSFKTKLLRDNHVKLVHKIVEMQTCNYCQKILKTSLEIHQYSCQYIGNWKCEECKDKFPNTALYRFRLHQRQHERNKQFKCNLCERTFIRKTNLEAHQMMHKITIKSNYACNVCKANFIDDLELKRHQYQQHSAEASHKCTICHKGFFSNALLQQHFKQFHSDNANNNSNATTTTYSSSSSSASLSSEQQHTCVNCNMTFKTLQKLQQHLMYGRDKNGNCLYTTVNKQERRKLQRQGIFPCFHCPRRFHLRSQLDKHLNTHDARLRPYQCEQCVVRCRTLIELKQHVNVAHLNIKAFACDTCGKCFGYKKDLRDHMLFHAEINVRCTEEGCDYVCKNEKALNDHIRHKHRLLSCEYCHAQFTRQKLTAHLRKIHRNEIDVELASESDNYYKTQQILNNNNDITQISFNLLNTEQQQLLKAASCASSPTISSSTSNTLLTTSTLTTMATIPKPVTAPATTCSSSILSLPSTSSLSSHIKVTSLNCNSNSIPTHNINAQPEHLGGIFAHDAPRNANDTTLALNSLVSSEHDLNNLVANGSTNMFLVPSTVSSATTTHNQFDQYFMASLMDTEQEIIVT